MHEKKPNNLYSYKKLKKEHKLNYNYCGPILVKLEVQCAPIQNPDICKLELVIRI